MRHIYRYINHNYTVVYTCIILIEFVIQKKQKFRSFIPLAISLTLNAESFTAL
jgi:hypothetical protein